MQYCKKCRHLTEDNRTSCSNCKRSRGIRPVQDNDLVYLMTCHKYEAEEIDALFEDNGIKHTLENFDLGIAQSPFDARTLKDDQNIFVEYGDINAANALLSKYEEEVKEEPIPDTMPRRKRLALDVIAILAFMLLVTLVVLASDYVANGLVHLFRGKNSAMIYNLFEKGNLLWHSFL